MSSAQILLATLDIQAANGNGNLQTWSPWVRFALQGPTPAGGQLTVSFLHPDGSTWFSLWSEVAEIGTEENLRFDLWTAQEEYHSSEVGAFPFQIKLDSAIDGVDEVLFEGRLEVAAEDGRFLARHDWLLDSAMLAFDMDDTDAPNLVFSWFLPGESEVDRVSAYLFHKGKRIFSSENRNHGYLEATRSVSYNDNATTYCAGYAAHFPKLKAWCNVEYADMDSWHILAQQPGEYELKIAVDRKPVRTLTFNIAATGRVETAGAYRGERGAWWIPLAINSIGQDQGGPMTDAPSRLWYGAKPRQPDTTLDTIYAAARFVEDAQNAASPTDARITEQLDRAEKAYRWYYDEMTRGTTVSGDPVDSDQCQMALERVAMLLPEISALCQDLGEASELPFAGAPRALGDILQALQEIEAGARRILAGREAASESALAPYRALLKNDKLKLFEERPVGEYRYYTSKKRDLETPEDFAQAQWWYFEGQEDAGYVTQKWTVRGWRFNADQTIVDTVETSGHGVKAPSSAFQ